MPVADEILALEKQLLHPHTRKTPAEILRILSDEFLEFGASGKIYDSAKAVEVLAGLDSGPYVLGDFALRELAAGIVLATYRLQAAGKTSLRSSIWRFERGRWCLLFHQGTPAATGD